MNISVGGLEGRNDRVAWLLIGFVATIFFAMTIQFPSVAAAASCAGGGSYTCDDGSPCGGAASCSNGKNCTSSCVVGGTGDDVECYVNILGIRPNHPSDGSSESLKTKRELRCTDGDPLCDLDGVANNRCTFQVSTCLANEDPNFPRCDASLGVSRLLVRNGRGRRFDPELANLQTRARLAMKEQPGTCSDPAYIQVPVSTNKACQRFGRGKKKLVIEATSGVNASGKQLQDKDTLTLTCYPSQQAACGNLTGRVTTTGGAPIAGASITVGTRGARTDFAGKFEISAAQLGFVPVKVSKAGFEDAVSVVEIRKDAAATIEIAMLDKALAISLNPATGGQIEIAGSRVSFPPNAFMKADGSTASGAESVMISVLPLDPTTDAIRAFPGGFYAVDSTLGASVILESVALVSVSAATASSRVERLQLAPGAAMSLELPIPRPTKNPLTGMPYAPGDELPLWWLNPATGVWEREGRWTVNPCTTNSTQLCLFATSTHMSWLNCDIGWDIGPPILGEPDSTPLFTEVSCLVGRVVDDAGRPANGIKVNATGVDYSATTRAETDASGSYCVNVKRASQLTLRTMRVGSDGLIETASESPVVTPSTAGGCVSPSTCETAPDLVFPTVRSCVAGRVIDSSGSGVANARVYTDQGGSTTANTNGEYCVAGAGAGTTIGLVAAHFQSVGTGKAILASATGACGDPSTCAQAPLIAIGIAEGVRELTPCSSGTIDSVAFDAPAGQGITIQVESVNRSNAARWGLGVKCDDGTSLESRGSSGCTQPGEFPFCSRVQFSLPAPTRCLASVKADWSFCADPNIGLYRLTATVGGTPLELQDLYDNLQLRCGDGRKMGVSDFGFHEPTFEREECDADDDALCPGLCQSDCRCGNVCGNGFREPDEECDGNNDDLCPGACYPAESAFACRCPFCGDGSINTASEVCEKGEDSACGTGCVGTCVCAEEAGSVVPCREGIFDRWEFDVPSAQEIVVIADGASAERAAWWELFLSCDDGTRRGSRASADVPCIHSDPWQRRRCPQAYAGISTPTRCRVDVIVVSDGVFCADENQADYVLRIAGAGMSLPANLIANDINTCGNGMRDAPLEECDGDDDAICGSARGCSASCLCKD